VQSTVIVGLVEAFGIAAGLLMDVVGVFGRVFGGIARVLGMGRAIDSNATSKGAAVRSVTTTTNAEDVSRKAIEKALMASMADQRPRTADTPTLLTGIQGTLGGILAVLNTFKIPTISEIVNGLGSFIGDIADKVIPPNPVRAISNMSASDLIDRLPGSQTAKELSGMLRSALSR
jgi:hypothetical protein